MDWCAVWHAAIDNRDGTICMTILLPRRLQIFAGGKPVKMLFTVTVYLHAPDQIPGIFLSTQEISGGTK